MDTSVAPQTGTTSTRPELIGRVVSINGSQASVELVARALRDDTPTVGKFMGLKTSKAVVIGLITEVTEQPLAPATGSQTFRKVASLDLIGEFYSSDDGALCFQPGFSQYQSAARADSLRSSILRKPLDASVLGGAPAAAAGYPPTPK